MIDFGDKWGVAENTKTDDTGCLGVCDFPHVPMVADANGLLAPVRLLYPIGMEPSAMFVI